jgi:hypothetical protein
MLKYTVFDGMKFKGCWDNRETALRYMATRDPVRPEWRLLEINMAEDDITAEVPIMVKKMAAASGSSKTDVKVHHLHAQGIEVRPKARQGRASR